MIKDFAVRAPDETTFWRVATIVGLAVKGDDDTYGPARDGISIDGPFYVIDTPGALNADGEVITPATYYPEAHFNFRLDLSKVTAWPTLHARWLAADLAEAHKAEEARTFMGVTLIEGINSPSQVWV